MKKTVHKAVKTGYGLGLLSLAKAKKVAGAVKKELQLNDKESLALARELVKGSEKASKEVLKVAHRHFERAVLRTGLLKRRELKGVQRIIKKKVSKVKKKVKAKVRKMDK